VREGGVYLAEDLITSYWPGQTFNGGYLKPDTFIEKAKGLVDTQNAWQSQEDALQVGNSWGWRL
jgi:hypothetical protein